MVIATFHVARPQPAGGLNHVFCRGITVRDLFEKIRVAGRRAFLPSEIRQVLTRVKADRLTYLSDAKLTALAERCLMIERTGVPGSIIEAGCALGGSSIVLASCKSPDRPQYVHDVFGMIPPPGPADGPDVHERYATITSGASEGLDGDTYYGYLPDLKTRVEQTFEQYGLPLSANNVHLVAGLVQDTLRVTEPVALAHIDVDWFEPVLVCLERIVPRLSPGGCLVIDDYRSWSGCQRAVDQFLKQNGQSDFWLDDRPSSLILTRRQSRQAAA